MTGKGKYRSRLGSAKRVLIKIGSRALVDKKGEFDRAVFRSVAEGAAGLAGAGKQVAIVSSGAILAGRTELGLHGRPLTMPLKQATAAVGQNVLMGEWARALARHGLKAGQILLTAEDLGDRGRFLNSRNAMEELFKLGVVPVINENDTVAVEEIRYGDNDHISTLIVGLMRAELLIMLTDIEGFCQEDPVVNPRAKVVHEVAESDSELFACAGPSVSGVGSGGMGTKISAARTVARKGVPTVIANAKRKGVIKAIVNGERVGTLFIPEGKAMRERKYWLAFAGSAKGSIRVDDGARKAVQERGKSLLPSGVIEVVGRFEQGAMVKVVDVKNREIARGLTQYSSADLKKIMGRKTSEIEGILGQMLYEEVIHRDYMALTGKGEKA